jgi:hypothetical protein
MKIANSSERKRTGAQVSPMPVQDAIHRQLIEVLTTYGLAAGKAYSSCLKLQNLKPSKGFTPSRQNWAVRLA